MKNDTDTSNTTSDFCLNQSLDSHSTVATLQDPFLNFDPKSRISFLDNSRIYCSLVALVKEEYPFDNALQDRDVQFLISISPFWLGAEYIAKLVTDLVPSSDGSPSGFVESIVTLLSSPHSAVVAAALSFLYITLFYSSLSVRCRLMESDLVSKVFAILQPHTVQISGNETIIYTLIQTFYSCIKLAFPSSLVDIGLTTAVDKHNHREMIFQKVVIPSSGFLTILISNRHVISEDFFDSFMSLLDTLLQIGPFHRPTVEFVLASPIVMAFSSCLSPVENRGHIRNTLINIEQSLQKWKDEGQEVVQCGKRMIQALFSEGFEDTLEQKMMNDTDEYDGRSVVDDCLQLSQLLGSNAKRPR